MYSQYKSSLRCQNQEETKQNQRFPENDGRNRLQWLGYWANVVSCWKSNFQRSLKDQRRTFRLNRNHSAEIIRIQRKYLKQGKIPSHAGQLWRWKVSGEEFFYWEWAWIVQVLPWPQETDGSVSVLVRDAAAIRLIALLFASIVILRGYVLNWEFKNISANQ